jgi:Holliday junction resolvasome RuvABC endonuclease subunit
MSKFLREVDFIHLSFLFDIVNYMKIMSFDVSSSVVGYAVLDISKKNEIRLVDSGTFKPYKKGHLFENLKNLREEIFDLLNQYVPDKVAIEDIAQFMPKVSSANTIITLALYNRMVGLAVYDFLDEAPELFSVMAIRHGLKQTSELPKKEDIPQLVENLLGVTLPVKYKKTGTIRPELYDEADAIAVGLYCSYKLTGKLDSIKRARKKK